MDEQLKKMFFKEKKQTKPKPTKQTKAKKSPTQQINKKQYFNFSKDDITYKICTTQHRNNFSDHLYILPLFSYLSCS